MDRNVNNCTPRHWHTELTREAGPSGPRPPNRIWGSWRARPEYKNSGPAWTRRLWRPLVCTPFWRPPRYAPRRGPIADATAHERCLRGDGFGDGFGGDFLLVGRSTGGDSAAVLASFARSAVGAPGSLRLRVAGSSPASGVSQLSAPQSLSDVQFSPSGAGDGLVTVSGSLSGVGTAHARSSITPPRVRAGSRPSRAAARRRARAARRRASCTPG